MQHRHLPDPLVVQYDLSIAEKGVEEGRLEVLKELKDPGRQGTEVRRFPLIARCCNSIIRSAPDTRECSDDI